VAVAYALQKELGIPSRALDAYDFTQDFPPDLDETSMVISISESGKSLTTCLAQEESRKKGAYTIGISANPSSRLAQNADLAITDPFLKEYPLGKTRTYLSTALLGILAGVLTSNPKAIDHFILDTRAMVRELRLYSEKWEDQTTKLCQRIGRITSQYMLAGFGIQLANAVEIGLKILEVVGENAASFQLEEFTHGPSASFRSHTGVILFQTDDRSLEKSIGISHGVSKSEAKLVIITNDPHADWPKSAEVIGLPNIPDQRVLGLFPAAMAAQYLMYHLTIEKGMNPDVNGEDIRPELGDIYAHYFPPGTH
jgi:fructoselysine-6-P-deglycase FrlB-like protein